MASSGQRLSREDHKKQRELEELRKAGAIPAERDEDGKMINPHIPNYISQAPCMQHHPLLVPPSMLIPLSQGTLTPLILVSSTSARQMEALVSPSRTSIATNARARRLVKQRCSLRVSQR